MAPFHPGSIGALFELLEVALQGVAEFLRQITRVCRAAALLHRAGVGLLARGRTLGIHTREAACCLGVVAARRARLGHLLHHLLHSLLHLRHALALLPALLVRRYE